MYVSTLLMPSTLDAMRERYATPMIWTPDLIAQLRRLYGEGLSYSAIAQVFQSQGYDANKNMMVGKGHRLSFPPRRKGRVSPAEKRRRLINQRIRDAQRKREKRRMDNEGKFSRSNFTITPEAMGRKALRSGLLIDLDPDQCRWPGEEIAHHTYLFCCEDVWPGKSYCAAHCQKSYGPNWLR